MAGIYRRLLEKIAASPQAVLEGRMSLPGKEKALVAVRALSGVDRGRAGSAVRALPESTLLSRQQQEDAR